jgi:hypothetical protein
MDEAVPPVAGGTLTVEALGDHLSVQERLLRIAAEELEAVWRGEFTADREVSA